MDDNSLARRSCARLSAWITLSVSCSAWRRCGCGRACASISGKARSKSARSATPVPLIAVPADADPSPSTADDAGILEQPSDGAVQCDRSGNQHLGASARADRQLQVRRGAPAAGRQERARSPPCATTPSGPTGSFPAPRSPRCSTAMIATKLSHGEHVLRHADAVGDALCAQRLHRRRPAAAHRQPTAVGARVVAGQYVRDHGFPRALRGTRRTSAMHPSSARVSTASARRRARPSGPFLPASAIPSPTSCSTALDTARLMNIDRAFLATFGRFWQAAANDVLVEPTYWADALAETGSNVLGAHPRSLLVSGEVRVGKTSFLKLLGRRLRATWLERLRSQRCRPDGRAEMVRRAGRRASSAPSRSWPPRRRSSGTSPTSCRSPSAAPTRDRQPASSIRSSRPSPPAA